jgi:anti-anti-sigma factor
MEQPFSLTSEKRGACAVISTSGYVNNVGGEAIAREFAKYFDAGTRHVVIDLHGSKVVNSVGMSFLIEIIEQLQDADGKLYFANLDPAVDKMLAIMGLFNFAGKGQTVDDALAALSATIG